MAQRPGQRESPANNNVQWISCALQASTSHNSMASDRLTVSERRCASSA